MKMNDKYYTDLQVMVDKAKDLKAKISKSDDDETIGYLKLALDIVYEDMRKLIKENDQD